ncbi:carboxylesterase/lipase family protein [Meiothermus hypogaeus]|uniref:Carboxylic ester hydrolase n=2 Tax=Meiothermus hypogaeus TaxID=884155 RepID=A0A511R1M9_9DEIN|nr:carboxylesterase/lipase family protein [Meiothermus hypogaeus]GEM83197.1 carboxylic ester hydrolase [Meiothermus hypogaeus NBRC 106114]
MTGAGEVCGKTVNVEGRTLSVFLGIPYAESTAGERRWKPPVPKAPWPGRLQATRFGNICPQNLDTSALPPQSEDCLSVNVWTPDLQPQSESLPVLVYIYGGAFETGASAVPIYDGAYLAARHGVVVVSFNYRVGALGFLAGIGDLQGNYGFLDQQLALRWINQNIGAFGGNPNRVTLMGESAGAASVGLHLLSAPASQPLFQQAVMLSNPLGLPYKNLGQARRVGLAYLNATNCRLVRDPVACLRQRPVEAILKGEESRLLSLSVLSEGLANFLTWSPVVDGSVIQQQPLEVAREGGFTKPTVIGTNTDESILFIVGLSKGPVSLLAYSALFNILMGDVGPTIANRYAPRLLRDYREPLEAFVNDYLFYCPNLALARNARAPVYTFRFTHAPSVSLWPGVERCKGRACHGDELPFIFNTLRLRGITNPGEQTLAREMSEYLGQFVKGQPLRGVGGLAWPAFTPNSNPHLRFDIPTQVFQPQNPNCAFLDEIGYQRTD